MENRLPLHERLTTAHHCLSICDPSAVRRVLDEITTDEVKSLKDSAKQQDGITIPAFNWNVMVASWLQLGELDRVECLIKSHLLLSSLTISFDDAVPYHKMRVHYENEKIALSVHSDFMKFDFWGVAYRLVEILPLIVFLSRNSAIPTLAHLALGDEGGGNELSFSSDASTSVLIPDMYFLFNNAYERERLSFTGNEILWSDRMSRVFWRGSTTGQKTSGWRSLPRIILCQIGRDNPDIPLDFGITNIVQTEYTGEDLEIRAAGLMKPFVSSDQFNRYKYHIDIDGNTNSWPGLFIKLLSGGAVLKVASPKGYRQWYYDRLEPWRNYIPVAADMSDLIDKVGWALRYDYEARKIGEAGRALASSMTLGTECHRMLVTVESAIKEGLLYV